MWITPFILAILLTESGGSHQAVNKKANAQGLMQMTPIGIKEAEIQCPKLLKTDRNMLNWRTNLQYGSCLYGYYRKESKRLFVDPDVGALILYNGGYRALMRYKRGQTLNHETANYIIRIGKRHEKFKKFNFIYIDCTNKRRICRNYRYEGQVQDIHIEHLRR